MLQFLYRSYLKIKRSLRCKLLFFYFSNAGQHLPRALPKHLIRIGLARISKLLSPSQQTAGARVSTFIESTMKESRP
ncbi:hypothetical protein ATN89_09075 [Comamonas thiooxydans]|nr:hypothetical protein ATN89_09075 [Comamonas thiooxydans]